MLLGEIVKIKHFSDYWSGEDLKGTVIYTKSLIKANAHLKSQ